MILKVKLIHIGFNEINLHDFYNSEGLEDLKKFFEKKLIN